MRMNTKQQYKFFKPRREFKSWLIFIAVALLAHALFLIFFQPEYLNIFERKKIGESGTNISAPSSYLRGKHFLLVNTYQEEEINRSEKAIVKVDNITPVQPHDSNYELPPIDFSLIQGIKSNSGEKSGNRRNRIFNIKPTPLLIPWPEYPEGATKNFNGQIKLNLYVNIDGKVEEIVLLKGSAPDSFNRKAVQAAKNIHFMPGSIDGKPAAMWVQISIGFQPR